MVARRRTPEDDLQRSIVDLLRKVPVRALWFHVPNGGLRNKRTAARLRGLGVRRGVPDLVFVGFDGVARFMELKAAKGVLTDEQKAWRDACSTMNVSFVVVRTLDEAVAALSAWGLIDASVSGSRAA